MSNFVHRPLHRTTSVADRRGGPAPSQMEAASPQKIWCQTWLPAGCRGGISGDFGSSTHPHPSRLVGAAMRQRICPKWPLLLPDWRKGHPSPLSSFLKPLWRPAQRALPDGQDDASRFLRFHTAFADCKALQVTSGNIRRSEGF